uniref:Replication factor C subunit 5 n=1 Tax=Phallusia mammillata TaxID=59560 RepID=A0A6F9DRB3_9ASCI|nr:replication factor C subunit 5 [Phallusia mammillata]
MSSASQPVECPLCFKNFSAVHVQSHVQTCQGTPNNNDTEMPPKRRKMIKVDSGTTKKNPSKSPWKGFKSIKKNTVQEPSQERECVVDVCTPFPLIPTERPPSLPLTESKPSAMEIFLAQSKPLAEVARPKSLEDYVGQTEVLGKETALNKLLNRNTIPSMIFWGPPGCGKTTLAHIIASRSKEKSETRFVKMSATSSGKADVQAMIKIASNEQRMFKRKTILFIDEIHRFNKLQQDTFLPHVENGTIVLLGATTENPSFALNSALLSRCRVIVLHKLEACHIRSLLELSITRYIPFCSTVHESSGNANGSLSDNGTDKLHVASSALDALSNYCDGDARIALNGLQVSIQSLITSDKKLCAPMLTADHVKSCLQRSHVLYDRTGDEHYAMMSALHKSVRGCDENAGLYWLTRMMLGGEDPKVIARRLIRMASEDIGLADPNALNIAVSTYHGCQYVGMPECDVILAECVVYLSRAAKSVKVYKALDAAKSCIRNHEGPLPSVPLHLRNPSTKLMRNLDYGKGYRYDAAKGEQQYLPEEMAHINFFDL